jgi:hypothetical protein
MEIPGQGSDCRKFAFGVPCPGLPALRKMDSMNQFEGSCD